jgi:hypothetical protein
MVRALLLGVVIFCIVALLPARVAGIVGLCLLAWAILTWERP